MHLVLLFVTAVLFHDIACAAVAPSARSNETDHSGRDVRQLSSPIQKSADVVLSRRNLFGLSNINNAYKLFSPLVNGPPRPKGRNPDAPRTFSSCTARDGLMGNCVPSAFCNAYGGRSGGSCGPMAVCCIHNIVKCGEKTTLNNTNWRSPPSVSSDTSCSLTVTLDDSLVEQRKPICQVRLDFKSFTVAQPNPATAHCDSDYLQVVGAVNKVPLICGDNDDQHMYLEAPSSTTEFLFLMKFGVSSITRSWNIGISLIPCGTEFLAPRDCLQYFTRNMGTGTVKSFNWRDTTGKRQLADMDYKICFRNEIITNRQKATRICYTQCVTRDNGQSFRLGGHTATSRNGAVNCPEDFVLIPNGFNPLIPTDVSDRYCGGALNPAANGGPPVTVCTTIKDFNMIYHTNDVEGAISSEEGSSGFCLDYEQRLA